MPSISVKTWAARWAVPSWPLIQPGGHRNPRVTDVALDQLVDSPGRCRRRSRMRTGPGWSPKQAASANLGAAGKSLHQRERVGSLKRRGRTHRVEDPCRQGGGGTSVMKGEALSAFKLSRLACASRPWAGPRPRGPRHRR